MRRLILLVGLSVLLVNGMVAAQNGSDAVFVTADEPLANWTAAVPQAWRAGTPRYEVTVTPVKAQLNDCIYFSEEHPLQGGVVHRFGVDAAVAVVDLTTRETIDQATFHAVLQPCAESEVFEADNLEKTNVFYPEYELYADWLVGKLLTKTNLTLDDVGLYVLIYDQPFDDVKLSPDGASFLTLSYSSIEERLQLWDTATGDKLAFFSGLSLAPPALEVGYGFGPDSQPFVITQDSDYQNPIVRIWDIKTQTQLAQIPGVTGNAILADYNPQSQSLVAASSLELVMWDVATGEQRFSLPQEELSAVAFAPDGQSVAVSGGVLTRVLDGVTGEELLVLPTGSRGVSYSQDGRFLLAYGFGGTLWDSKTGLRLLEFGRETGIVVHADLRPDGSLIVTAGDDHVVRLWDAGTGEELMAFADHLGRVSSVAFSPDGQRIFSASEDATVRVADIPPDIQASPPEISPDTSGGCIIRMMENVAVYREPDTHSEMVLIRPREEDLVLEFDGQYVDDQTGYVWYRLVDGWWLLVLTERDAEWPPTCTLLPMVEPSTADTEAPTAETGNDTAIDGEGADTTPGMIASAPAQVWTVNEYQNLAFSPSGQWLALADLTESAVQLRNVETGEVDQQFRFGPETVTGAMAVYGAMAFSPDGTVFAGGDLEGGILLWEVGSGTQIAYLQVPDPTYTNASQIVFSPDGQTIAALDPMYIHLWDVASQEYLAGLDATDCQGIAFSPDGAVLISSSYQGVTLWDATTGEMLGKHEGFFPDGVWLSPGGTAAAYKSSEQVLEIRDPITWEQQARLENDHPWAIEWLALNRDGSVFASAHFDEDIIRLWDIATGTTIAELEYTRVGFLRALLFSPNGAVLAAGDTDATVRVWILDPTALSEPPF
jgi:WD40 repeat protein